MQKFPAVCIVRCPIGYGDKLYHQYHNQDKMCIFTMFVYFGFTQIIVITGTEHTHFMFAIPKTDDSSYPPIVTVSAKKGTLVNLVTEQSSDSYYVRDNSSYTFVLSNDIRVTNGVEVKGVEVTSDEPVSVQIGTQRQLSYLMPDEIMVRPITTDDTEYLISSYPGTPGSSSFVKPPTSYFMIISQSDESLVEVFNFNEIWVQQYSAALNKFEVFTQDYYHLNDATDYTDCTADYTGWRVVASQPVAVISGHGNAYFGRSTQHTCDSMPSKVDMGSHYVTFPVFFGIGTEGYVVRIVGSTTEYITVQIPEIGVVDGIVPRGRFLEVKSLNSSSLMRVSYSVLRLYKIRSFVMHVTF